MQFYERALTDYNKYFTDPQKKDYFAVAATIGLLIVLLLMLYPAAVHVSKLNNEVSKGNEYLQSIKDKRQNLETAKTNYEAVKDDLDLIAAALPIGSEVETYLKNPLETLAQKHNLTIKSLQITDVPVSAPTGPSENLVVRDFEYFVSFDGDFLSFKNFLVELENFTRTTIIEGFEVKKVLDVPTITLKAKTNFLGEPNNLVPNEVSNAQ